MLLTLLRIVPLHLPPSVRTFRFSVASPFPTQHTEMLHMCVYVRIAHTFSRRCRRRKYYELFE